MSTATATRLPARSNSKPDGTSRLGRFARNSCQELDSSSKTCTLAARQGFRQAMSSLPMRFAANVAIGPLLHSVAHLNSLELVHPKLTLVSDNNGKEQITHLLRPLRHKKTPGTGEEARRPQECSSIKSILSCSLTPKVAMAKQLCAERPEPSADVKGINVDDAQFRHQSDEYA